MRRSDAQQLGIGHPSMIAYRKGMVSEGQGWTSQPSNLLPHFHGFPGESIGNAVIDDYHNEAALVVE